MQFHAARQPGLTLLSDPEAYLLTPDDWKITFDGHAAQAPEAVYVANGAGASWWVPHMGYGENLINVSDTNPNLLHQPSQWRGEFSEYVKFEGTYGSADADYYEALTTTLCDIGTEDFIILTGYQSGTSSEPALTPFYKINTTGWRMYGDNYGRTRFRFTDADETIDVSNTIMDSAGPCWLHTQVVCDRSGSGKCYTHGVGNGAVDISSLGTLSNSGKFSIGGNAGGAINSAHTGIGYFALWKKASWLPSHEGTAVEEVVEFFYTKIRGLLNASAY